VNNCFVNDGFRAIDKVKLLKTIPIPTPAPAKLIVANPAPINFEAFNNKNQSSKLVMPLINKS
jgi:hypothetical protein